MSPTIEAMQHEGEVERLEQEIADVKQEIADTSDPKAKADLGKQIALLEAKIKAVRANAAEGADDKESVT